MSLTEAMKEAYADPDIETVIYDTLELNHPAFEGPQHFVANVEEDMVLGGVLHKAAGCQVILTGFDDDGETSGQLVIDNISAHLVEPLRDAVRAGHPLTVVYRAYTETNKETPGEVRSGLILSKVSLNATSASGTLEPASKHDSMAFPRLTYSPEKFKALHGAA
jgi:hypothetical protein